MLRSVTEGKGTAPDTSSIVNCSAIQQQPIGGNTDNVYQRHTVTLPFPLPVSSNSRLWSTQLPYGGPARTLRLGRTPSDTENPDGTSKPSSRGSGMTFGGWTITRAPSAPAVAVPDTSGFFAVAVPQTLGVPPPWLSRCRKGREACARCRCGSPFHFR